MKIICELNPIEPYYEFIGDFGHYEKVIFSHSDYNYLHDVAWAVVEKGDVAIDTAVETNKEEMKKLQRFFIRMVIETDRAYNSTTLYSARVEKGEE